MSRIDEALRRASASKGTDPGAAARLRDEAPGVLDRVSRVLSLADYPLERGGDPTPASSRELPDLSIAAPRAGTTKPLGKLGAEVEGKLVTDPGTSRASVEQYRRLAAALHHMQVHSGFRTLMVSSALPGDGKTLTVVNLALTLSESYQRRVLLVDADLRRPSVHNVFRIPNAVGLSEGLRMEPTGTLPLIEVSPRLTVLPAGRPDNTPMAGLTSERMRLIVKEAAARFDWVILDTPPIALMSDASLLAGVADGVLLVIGANSTDYQSVKRTMNELGSERIVGVVLNRVDDTVLAPNNYYNYYRDPAPSSGDRGPAS